MPILDILSNYRAAFLAGLSVTLELALLVWSIGIATGVLIGAAAARWRFLFGVPARAISFFLTSVPVLALLFWVHYPLQAELHVVINGFFTAVGVLVTLNAALVFEVVRNVLTDFPRQYVDAGRVAGLTARDIFRYIQFPIVLRQALPSVLMIQVGMLQATLFASLISVDELFRIAQRINAQIYRPVEVYTAVAMIYLLLTMPMTAGALWLRARYTRDFSEK